MAGRLRGCWYRHVQVASSGVTDYMRGRRVSIAGALCSSGKADLASEARVAVGHADSCSLMMRVNVFEPVFFTQLHNDVRIGIPHDRENVIDTFGRNPFRKRPAQGRLATNSSDHNANAPRQSGSRWSSVL
jgi:hypothetical protein